MTAFAAEIPRILCRVPDYQLAAVTGRCKATVRNWLNGKTEPSASDLLAAIHNFDVVAKDIDTLTKRTRATKKDVEEATQFLAGAKFDTYHSEP